jgi:hypothetical protein
MLDDLYLPIIPVYEKVIENTDSALFSLVNNILLHLYHSVLAPEDVSASYGLNSKLTVKIPATPNISLDPDKEWMEKLNFICDDEE